MANVKVEFRVPESLKKKIKARAKKEKVSVAEWPRNLVKAGLKK